MDNNNQYSTLGYAALIGIFLAIGRMLAAGEKITAKMAIGRAVVNAGFALAGFAILTFVPSLGLEGKIGVASLMASLGTTGVEMMAKRVIGGKVETPSE